ncbi:SgcJ/EcaC family oxidoreductase [Oscillatoria sp. FACHB-1407]|uniref:SgcJ/EcaC family oxidoreductase n=1 Tax=Oscillatoria sp. FACHB-1407 TaxID=2692847 RepID=UPI0016828B40|nr:SgcJ/EcaC family oxidoreductase [Oscillatoria sp. FACHB-1407]MBD2465278.1 SgcJ/EcaC family oxidoreductase [Oscillatoria sp. FACHB-1407]
MINNQEILLNTVEDALAAWNRKDAKAFSEYFVEDAEFTDVVGQLMSTRTEIERLHHQPFSTVLKNAQLETKEIRVKKIRSDVASVDVKWETTGHTKPDGTPLPPRYGLLHLVVIEDPATPSQSNQWRIAVAHNVDYTATYGSQDAREVAK